LCGALVAAFLRVDRAPGGVEDLVAVPEVALELLLGHEEFLAVVLYEDLA
jgi:hypothetical protein